MWVWSEGTLLRPTEIGTLGQWGLVLLIERRKREMSLLEAMEEGKERNNWVALEKFLEEMGTERTQQMRV